MYFLLHSAKIGPENTEVLNISFGPICEAKIGNRNENTIPTKFCNNANFLVANCEKLIKDTKNFREYFAFRIELCAFSARSAW